MEGSTEFPVLTIGHSNHPLPAFTALLQQHNAVTVVDVRTSPHSRYSPQFNHAALRDSLEALGIDYVFSGRRAWWAAR